MTEDEMVDKMVYEAVRAHRRNSQYPMDVGQVKSIVEAVSPFIQVKAMRIVHKSFMEFYRKGYDPAEMMDEIAMAADEMEDDAWRSITTMSN